MSRRERDRLDEPPSPEEAQQQAEAQRQAAERAEWQRRANDPESAGPGLGRAQDLDPPRPAPKGGPAIPGLQQGPVADPAPVPRVVKDFERAPAGTQRFKCRALPFAGQVPPTLYVLAPDGDEDAARAFYLEQAGIGEQVKAQEKAGVPADKIERPVVHLKALPD
jgi:hypothetical protein